MFIRVLVYVVLIASYLQAIVFANTIRTPPTERAIITDRHRIRKHIKVPPTQLHKCIFGIKLRNLELLEPLLLDISNPDHPSYGDYLTSAELGSLIQNLEAVAATEAYFNQFEGVKLVSKTIHGQLLTFEAPISLWESILSTKFYNFEVTDLAGSQQTAIRAEEYYLPEVLLPYVDYVLNTVQMPITSLTRSISQTKRMRTQAYTPSDGTVTPTLLSSFYEINQIGTSNSSQMVFATLGQYLSVSDTATFTDTFGLVGSVAHAIGGHVSDSVCAGPSGSSLCNEANLDVQYIFASGQGVETYYYYDSSVPDFLSTWLVDVLSMTTIPSVISVSYGTNENHVTASSRSSFDSSILQLALQGVTMVAGSGDDGAPGHDARKDSSKCGYEPLWPSTSPYVLSVGATQGPEVSSAEIACSASTGGVITTGGGFSNYYDTPSWQRAKRKAYFQHQSPVAGYNATGRGYPDVSLLGRRYSIVIGGSESIQSGTSASTPVIAGMIATINSHRVRDGRPLLGWINPTLYKNSSFFANDITSGDNKCTQSVCCSEGFVTSSGWDPVTGLGSVNFKGLYNLLYNLGYTYTPSPTATPTARPTARPTAPTAIPTARPTATPTTPRPTANPTPRPTSAAPTVPPKEKAGASASANIGIIIGVVVGAALLIIGGGAYYYYFMGGAAGLGSDKGSDSGSDYSGDSLDSAALATKREKRRKARAQKKKARDDDDGDFVADATHHISQFLGGIHRKPTSHSYSHTLVDDEVASNQTSDDEMNIIDDFKKFAPNTKLFGKSADLTVDEEFYFSAENNECENGEGDDEEEEEVEEDEDEEYSNADEGSGGDSGSESGSVTGSSSGRGSGSRSPSGSRSRSGSESRSGAGGGGSVDGASMSGSEVAPH